MLAVAGKSVHSTSLNELELTDDHEEIKMIVLTLIASSTPVLEGDDYRIVDKLNITSVPPEGEFKLLPRIS
jgi:hypothetical protein